MARLAHHRYLPASTHTLELRQVAEINGLVVVGLARLTPADLGVDHAPDDLLATPLRRLVMEGSPSFPYLFGVFGGTDLVLHTEHLRRLSRALGLHHHWGL